MGKRILISDCTVIPLDAGYDEKQAFYTGEIGIEGEELKFVGPTGTIPQDWVPDTVINGKDKVALPGLINAHTHAAMSLFRGYADDLPLMEWLEEKIWPLERKLKDEDVYWGTMLSILEMIKTGTTTFADMYFFMDKVAEAVAVTGIRASLSRGLIGLQLNAGKALKESRRFIKNWHRQEDGRITTMLGPHAPYTCPPPYMRKVLDLAAELQTGLHIHLAETEKECADIQKKYGMTPIQLMDSLDLFEYPVLAAHCVHINQTDIEVLTSKDVGVVHNPQSNMKLASGIAPVNAMLKAGIRVALGTDGSSSNNDLDMLQEMRSAAFLQKVGCKDPTVLPAWQVLEMATCNGACALGLAGEVGSLCPGMKADVILLNFEQPHYYPHHDVLAHLVYASQASDVETVIVNGSILMKNREMLTIDEQQVYWEVEKRARQLIMK